MSDLRATTYRPGAGEYAWTFGGAAPVMRLRTPCALELYTEDCFAGRVQSADDLVSRLNITGLNPQTGPFWIEGAEPGDTVAVLNPSINPRYLMTASSGQGSYILAATSNSGALGLRVGLIILIAAVIVAAYLHFRKLARLTASSTTPTSSPSSPPGATPPAHLSFGENT